MQQHAQADDARYRQWRAEHGVAAATHACELLQAFAAPGAPHAVTWASTPPQPLAAAVASDWAASGLMPLCGHAEGPPRRAHHAIPSCARGALLALRALTGNPVLAGVDGATLLSERAAYHGRSRAGRTSVNGQCHLLRTADGWIALNLARPEDMEALPAWLAEGAGRALDAQDVAEIGGGHLAPLHATLASRATAALVARGALFGLPIAAPAEHPSPAGWFAWQPGGRVCAPARAPRVLDLSSLWAGPLAAHLLHAAGAPVTRIGSSARPDASREGLPEFHALLNAGKAQQVLDLQGDAGVRALRAAVDAADIVIESARPRALRQFGIHADVRLQHAPGKLWLRIAGHDADASAMLDEALPRVAFGDDAAIAGGAALVDAGSGAAKDDGAPLFCGDALADPLTGLHAAVAALALWRAGRGGLLTLSLAGVTRWCVERTRHIPVLEPSAATVHIPAVRARGALGT